MKDNLKKIINPKHATLLVVDMQKDFLNLDGKLAKSGQDLSAMRATIKPIEKLVRVAHQAKIPVIFTTMIDGLKYRSEVGRYLFSKKEKIEENICVLEGSEGSEFSEIRPAEQDEVIVKHNYCCFHQTELEPYLQGRQIKTLIVVGVKTNACIDTTIRTAYHKGYFVVVPTECVASDDKLAHQKTLENVERYFGDVVGLKDVLDCWAH